MLSSKKPHLFYKPNATKFSEESFQEHKLGLLIKDVALARPGDTESSDGRLAKVRT